MPFKRIIDVDTGDEKTSPNEISKSFNKYLTNVGINLAATIPRRPNCIKCPRVLHSFTLFDTSEAEVCSLINRLKTNKAARLDDIPTNI